jgi:hypothetical protein
MRRERFLPVSAHRGGQENRQVNDGVALRTDADAPKPSIFVLGFVLVYVSAVLTIDALAAGNVRTPIHWGKFLWRSDSNFDYFKFIFWLIVPIAVSLPRIDWQYFTFKRWKRVDAYLLIGLAAAGLLALFVIPLVPPLRAWYPSLAEASPGMKEHWVRTNAFWLVSWFPGWEFLNRYFLLRPLAERWPRFGWLLVPIAEGLYHLQKHWLETALSVAGSFALTGWAAMRRNLLLPFLVHGAVEVGLVVFVLLV